MLLSLFRGVFGRRLVPPAEPQAGFLAAAGGDLGSFLWHRGLHVHDLGGRAVIGGSQEPSSILRHWPRPQSADPYVLRRAAYRVSSPAICLGSQGRPFSSRRPFLPPFQGWITTQNLRRGLQSCAASRLVDPGDFGPSDARQQEVAGSCRRPTSAVQAVTRFRSDSV